MPFVSVSRSQHLRRFAPARDPLPPAFTPTSDFWIKAWARSWHRRRQRPWWSAWSDNFVGLESRTTHFRRQCGEFFFWLLQLQRVRRSFVHAFVTSRVDYCNALSCCVKGHNGQVARSQDVWWTDMFGLQHSDFLIFEGSGPIWHVRWERHQRHAVTNTFQWNSAPLKIYYTLCSYPIQPQHVLYQLLPSSKQTRKHGQSYRHADPRRQKQHTAVAARVASNRVTVTPLHLRTLTALYNCCYYYIITGWDSIILLAGVCRRLLS